MSLTLEEFKERLRHQCDPETLVDILEITIDDLMDAFEDRIWDERDKLDDTFDIYGEQYEPLD